MQEYYEKYGVIYSHGSIQQALAKIEPGDRICMEPTSGWGYYACDDTSDTLDIKV